MLLDGQYSNEYVTEQLSLEFNGANRIKKGLRIVNKIVQNNPIVDLLLDNESVLRNVLKRQSERNVVLISLLNTAFPFSFDTLASFGKYFSVQEFVNRETINRDISKIYGGNRATANAFDSVVPMFLEAGFFERTKPGLYHFEAPSIVQSKLTLDVYKESFNINTPEILNADMTLGNPYFLFVERSGMGY